MLLQVHVVLWPLAYDDFSELQVVIAVYILKK